MRKLAVFAFSFAAATALHVYLLSVSWGLAFGALLLAAGIAFCFFRGRRWKPVRIAAFGMALGFFWCSAYEAVRIAPLLSLCGQQRVLTAEVCEMPEETDWGCVATARYRGARVRVRLQTGAQTLSPGDRITVTADVESVLYGSTWNSLYMQSHDISLTARQCGTLQIEPSAHSELRYWPQYAAAGAQEVLNRSLPEEVSGFAAALLLGQKNGLRYQQQNAMSLAGVSHVIAVSGLHLSVLLTALSTLLRHRQRLMALIALPLLWAFAAIVGFTPSVTRAAVMQTLLLLAPILKRESDAPTALGAALLVLLLKNPWAIANVSLQLSFAAVGGILLCTERINTWLSARFQPHARHLPRLLRRLVGAVFSAVATTFGAQLLTTPLCACYFGQISLVSPVSNLLLLPLINACFILILLLVLLGLLWMPLATLLGAVLAWPMRLVLWLIDRFADLPHAAVYTSSFYVVAWLILCYVLIGIFLLGRGRRPLLLAGGLCVSLVGTLLFSALNPAELRMTVLDVGQGQCILLQSGTLTAMVDCGGDQGDADGEKAARTLLSSGIDTVDLIVLTHYDTDHICGLEQFLSRIPVQLLLAPDIPDENRESIFALAAEYGIPVQLVTTDLTIQFSGGSMQVFAPVYGDEKNVGLSALLSVQEYDILITGDMDTSAELALLRTHSLPDLELLVAGHHGSRYATSDTLLRATMPETVVISVGENHFGHPAQEVLDRIAAIGAAVVRTDLDGDIIIMR